jgi:chromate reductase
MQERHVGVIIGSLRKKSFAAALARALEDLAPPAQRLVPIAIGELPLYNEDLETATPPPAWSEFRAKVAAVDGLLFVTPEYNRGIPGGLKNAIDVGSRPWGKSVWAGKRAAIVGISGGALGGMAASHQLRVVLSGVNVPVMTDPEVFVSNAGTLFDQAGNLTNPGTREFLTTVMQKLAAWI